ncbi:MAG: hypothetical protein ACLUFP_04540 [Streptococcus salivarius]
MKQNYMRMTTSNIVTQVLSRTLTFKVRALGSLLWAKPIKHNSITLDRQRDLNTPSGVILGAQEVVSR